MKRYILIILIALINIYLQAMKTPQELYKNLYDAIVFYNTNKALLIIDTMEQLNKESFAQIINLKDTHERNLLHYAIIAKNVIILKTLLNIIEKKLGKDIMRFIRAQDIYGNTALHYATSYATAKILIKIADRIITDKEEYNHFVNAQSKDDWTPLHSAIYAHERKTVFLLLSKGACLSNNAVNIINALTWLKHKRFWIQNRFKNRYFNSCNQLAKRAGNRFKS